MKASLNQAWYEAQKMRAGESNKPHQLKEPQAVLPKILRKTTRLFFIYLRSLKETFTFW
jgi:hypothetical protein